MNGQQLEKVRNADGFVAALDQSGGSTPKALALYGLTPDSWSGEAEMFDRVHQMRTRIITSPSFDGDRILGAILFEDTMDRSIDGIGSARFLWERKRIVPFLKIDRGLEEPSQGVRRMKPIPGLDALLARAVENGVFGTKERSVIDQADPAGIRSIVDQQFELANRVLAAGLIPIVEPEVDIHCPQKAEAEELLRTSILEALEALDALDASRQVMLKLTLPDQDGFYRPLVDHPRVLRVVALSGGYGRDDANARLARNPGVIASFSRALTEGLTAGLDDRAFDAALDRAIAGIFEASKT